MTFIRQRQEIDIDTYKDGDAFDLLNAPWVFALVNIDFDKKRKVIYLDHPAHSRKIVRKDLSGKLKIEEYYEYAVEMKRCADDFLYWLGKYVYTVDPDNLLSRTSKFPYVGLEEPDSATNIHGFYHLYELLQGHQVITIYKSRQVMISWFFCAYFTWVSLFFPTPNNPLQSKDEESSAKLIRRIRHILRELPEWQTHKFLKMKPVDKTLNIHNQSMQRARDKKELLGDGPDFKLNSIFIPKTGAYMEGKPSTATAITGETTSKVYLDEAQQHYKLRETLTEIRPALNVRGQLIVAGTPKRNSEFEKIVFPTKQSRRSRYRQSMHTKFRGIKWLDRDASRLITIGYWIRIDRPRGGQWAQEQKKKFENANDYLRMYEHAWDYKGDEVVWPEFDRKKHCVYSFEKVLEDLHMNRATLYMDYDGGFGHSAAQWFAVYPRNPDDSYSRRVVLYDVECEKMSVSQKAKLFNYIEESILKMRPVARFPGHDVAKVAEQTGQSDTVVWSQYGIYWTNPGKINRAEGQALVNRLFRENLVGFVKELEFLPDAIENYYEDTTSKDPAGHSCDSFRYGQNGDVVFIEKLNPVITSWYEVDSGRRDEEQDAYTRLSTTDSPLDLDYV